MQKLFTILLAGLFFNLIHVLNVEATGVPRPIGGENRIKIINYTPNTVFKFVGHYEYQSIIEFGMDEEIDTISMGTPTPWQLVPAGNRIFIKPVEENATTNMTVITNKRMYFFEMHAEEASSISDAGLNFVVKFVYPEQYNVAGGNTTSDTLTHVNGNSGPDMTKPELYNFKYSISGSSADIEPTQVFDDGEFTYFKFKSLNAEIPAIFLVDRTGKEGLVNFRVTGGYVVVERVANRFTLRRGPDTICVFNEAGPFKKKEKKFLFF
ncbi:MAG: putative type secretion system protein [Candidatus Midichloriaceae bacterium]|jgi:type IV secretion system protein VirB9|nr:putative type secretion system protein [Candidatus Midichloriaceae bacterium]